MKKDAHRKQSAKRNQMLAIREAHAYQLLLMHEESQEAWDEFRELEEGGDPEHARKLAAIRTELLRRHQNVGRSQD